MSQRKISYWLMFIVKALPLVFLIIIAIYSNRHEVFTNNATYEYVSATDNSTIVTASNMVEGVYYSTIGAFNKVFNMRSMFNLDSFYLWWCDSIFVGNTPIIFETVFNCLIYEIFIEIITLLYSFLIFVVKFAKRFVGGFYEKTNL